MEEKEVLIRHGEPNKFDIADYGAEIQIIGREDYTIYRQESKDPETPDWQLVGTFKIEE